MATSVVCRILVRERARHRSLACSGRYRPPPRHANCKPDARCQHAAPLGDQLQVPSRFFGAVSAVALGTALERGDHNDRSFRMTPENLTVTIVPTVRSIAGKRRKRAKKDCFFRRVRGFF
jgi:hypothetical protein